MVADSVGATLGDVTLFRGLPEGELAELARQTVQRRYNRGEMIFAQGEAGDGLYTVIEGHVSINRESLDGDELILAVYESGEYFGELALFDQEPRSASAVAIDDVTALFLSRSAFRNFLQAHPAAVFTCLEVIVGQFRRLTDVADEIALMDVRRRLSRRLLRLEQRGMLEIEEDPWQHRRPFRITQQQLASMMGATRESVNKYLHAFADEGLIHMERGHIRILDREGLEEISEGFR